MIPHSYSHYSTENDWVITPQVFVLLIFSFFNRVVIHFPVHATYSDIDLCNRLKKNFKRGKMPQLLHGLGNVTWCMSSYIHHSRSIHKK